MATLVKANESTASRRRVFFDLRSGTDGFTPVTGETGQPQVSSDGGAWTNTGIGTVTEIGNGRYYADLTQTLVATAGTQIQTRYKTASTAETPGDSVQVVAYDPYDSVRLGLTAMPNAAAAATGGLPTVDAANGVKVSVGTGTGQLTLTSGAVTVGTNNDKTAYALTSSEHTTIAGDVLSATASSYNVAGTIGAKINAAASAGDPWSTSLPGSYGAGTAGNILGNNLNATVGSRLASASFSPPLNWSNLAITPTGAVTAGTVSDKTGYALTSSEHTAIAGDVLNATATSFNTSGSIGSKINAAATAGDPWSTTIPGSYASGTAGYILGNRLDATVSSRSTYAGTAVPLSLTQTLGTPRTLDAVADGSITLNDVLWAALAGAAGKESVSGTSYAVQTPSTGTTIRTFVLDSATTPTSRT